MLNGYVGKSENNVGAYLVEEGECFHQDIMDFENCNLEFSEKKYL